MVSRGGNWTYVAMSLPISPPYPVGAFQTRALIHSPVDLNRGIGSSERQFNLVVTSHELFCSNEPARIFKDPTAMKCQVGNLLNVRGILDILSHPAGKSYRIHATQPSIVRFFCRSKHRRFSTFSMFRPSSSAWRTVLPLVDWFIMSVAKSNHSILSIDIAPTAGT